MKDLLLTVLRNEEIGRGVYELTLQADKLPEIKAGQFVNLEAGRADLILRRPFGLHSWDYMRNTFKVAFDVKGKGTEVLKEAKVGQKLQAILPLGKSFPEVAKGKKIMLVGGGTGVLPLLAVAQSHTGCEIYAFLGFGDKSAVIKEKEFSKCCKQTIIATDNGSYGEKGFVTDSVKKLYDWIKPDYIFGCGPPLMMKALAPYTKTSEIYVTIEAHMACGVGVCLVCACAINRGGETEFKRTCKDGPVFRFEEVFYES